MSARSISGPFRKIRWTTTKGRLGRSAVLARSLPGGFKMAANGSGENQIGLLHVLGVPVFHLRRYPLAQRLQFLGPRQGAFTPGNPHRSIKTANRDSTRLGVWLSGIMLGEWQDR